MNISLVFTRILFAILSIFFMTIYMHGTPGGTPVENTLIGFGLGIALTLLLYCFDTLFRRFNLRSFNIAVVGLFIGFLMGLALVLIFGAIIDISIASFTLSAQIKEIIKISLFLFGTYLGTMMTLRSSDELYISIPFVKLSPTSKQKRDLIIDGSAIADARLVDLCLTGLLDRQIIIPRFVVKELYSQVETGNEHEQTDAKHSLEVIKRLEELTKLGVRFNDTDFPEVKEMEQKLLRLSRLLDANLLSTEISKTQTVALDGVSIINMNALSNALKPLSDTGEIIQIKVQRHGKEENQGVGYLEDGTMVVINGGGDYIGELIDCHVLSVKHTTSGRMIFCNAMEK